MKRIKVFWNGQRLKDIYPHATRWQVFKYRVYMAVRRLVQVVAIVAVLVGSGWLGATFYPETVLAIHEVKINTLPERLDQIKDDVVLRLEQCESGGAREPEALITYDPDKSGKKGNIASLGSLQFKVHTVQHYISKFDGRALSQVDAIKIATDRNEARELAKRVIFEEEGGVFNWANCAKKLNLVPEIEVIKKLSQ